jgi:molybdopterin/thiamine biosynthesis adenylyltransferase
VALAELGSKSQLACELLQSNPTKAEPGTMIELRLQEHDVSSINGSVLEQGTERCALLFAARTELANGDTRFIVNHVEFPRDDQYTYRGELKAELTPTYIAHVSKKAARQNWSLIFLHSHPGTSPPQFSPIDDHGEQRLKAFLSVRMPGMTHGSVVASLGGWRGRELGTHSLARIVSVGSRIQTLFEPSEASDPTSLRFDRQVRALGAAGQRHLASLTVAVVGLGGTGSVTVEQLAYLGVRKFVLIDPDRIEMTNLNRVVGSKAGDVGRLKTDVAAELISSIAPDSQVYPVQGDVTRTAHARALLVADFIFSCTDSHGSRAVLQQVAYQYLIPCIDVGSVITAREGHVQGIHGRIQALAPGYPCFTCCSLLDPEEVRRDMMTAEERRRDPYIEGAYEPAPAVISINSTVTSLGMTMFLAMMVGIPSESRHILYNARSPSLKSVSYSRNPNCYICSPRGVLARGDTQLLFTRDD